MPDSELQLEQKIEAILFYTAEPVRITTLSKILGVEVSDVHSVADALVSSLKNRGIRLITHNNELSLVTAPKYAELIEKIIREERERDLGRAGLETLSIVAYKGPVTRKEIEYIRGVNCQFVLRSLLLRGLVEKKPSRDNDRMMLYGITNDTLRYLGIGSASELPEYTEVQSQLEVVEDTEEEHGE